MTNPQSQPPEATPTPGEVASLGNESAPESSLDERPLDRGTFTALVEPRSPSRLPLLFALDAKLAIANGFHYLPDCGKPLRDDAAGGSEAVYCGKSFSDGSFSGDADGFGGSESRRSSNGGGARDGGGGGCGGSCGGGGD